MNEDPVRRDLIIRQMGHSLLGELFSALYTFSDRTIEDYFWDAPGMPHPIILLESLPNRRPGCYDPMSSSMLANVITLNPHVHKTGAEIAETLAHELVHLWENHIGQPTTNNIHTDQFHERMWTLYGIRTAGNDGRHMNVDIRWEDWMDQNADLRLGEFILPGADAKPPRRMFKHTCPSCGASFHARTQMKVRCDNDECKNHNTDIRPKFTITQ